MAEYTYKCVDCGVVISLNEYHESPYWKPHAVLSDDWDEKYLEQDEEAFIAFLVDCYGVLERVYLPPNIIIKGKH